MKHVGYEVCKSEELFWLRFFRKFLTSKSAEIDNCLFDCDQPGAQEKFLEIKNAYQTLVDSKSRSRYDAGGSRTRSDDWDPFQWGSGRKTTQKEEEFYGFGTLSAYPLINTMFILYCRQSSTWERDCAWRDPFWYLYDTKRISILASTGRGKVYASLNEYLCFLINF